MQLTMFPPETSWQLPTMDQLPDWNTFSRVGVDVETKDPSLGKGLGPGARRGGYIIGFCLHFEDFRSFYLPIRHGNGTNLPIDPVLNYVRDNLKKFKGSIVGANLSYDIDYLCQEFGLEIKELFPNVKAFLDTQIAEPLIDENQFKFGLDAVALRHGLPQKDEVLLRDVTYEFGSHNGKRGKGKRKPLSAKGDLHKLPPQYVGPYGEWDAELPCRIMRKQERIIDENDLWQIFRLESRCLPALVDMTRRGVRIDFDKMSQIEEWIFAQEKVALDLVHQQTGIRLKADDLAQPNAVAEPLKYIGAKLKRNVKNQQYNIDQSVLRALKHPVADAILTARKVNKVRRDFIAGIREHAIGDRLHCTFHQLKGSKSGGGLSGAGTGRLSSSHVNIQQQPSPKDTDPDTMHVEDHLSLMWRQVYIPDEGGQWACLDYSQQEPRILHHYAEICGCPGARAAAQRYRDDPKCDNHQMMSELTGLTRKVAKVIYLGKCYRMAAAKFSRSLGLPTVIKEYDFGDKKGQKYETAGPEAAAILKSFKNGAPYIDKLAEIAEEQGMAKGHIKTLLGRHCHFPKEMKDNPDGGPQIWTGNYLNGYCALNKLIQGSAADQTKAAMVEAYENGIPLGCQVHDELNFTYHDPSQVKELHDIMINAAPLRVPSKVDVECGPNWAEIKTPDWAKDWS
jgi:DNA polymerase I-like protein with 3'-5' exonuclease and polymerase domains